MIFHTKLSLIWIFLTVKAGTVDSQKGNECFLVDSEDYIFILTFVMVTIWTISERVYRKIPKISPGAYIFQKPYLRRLSLEGLIFRGAYLWREICVSKLIGLAL